MRSIAFGCLAGCLVVLAAGCRRGPSPHGTELRFTLDHAPPAALHADHVFSVDERPRGAPDLSRWYAVDVDDVVAATAALEAAGAKDISARPALVPAVMPAGVNDDDDSAPHAEGGACPVKTPPFDARQGYIPAMRVPSAWKLPGGRGQGIAVADVEGDWNAHHEDLPALTHVAGRHLGSGWSAHGTAVLGEVAARDNGLGMVGIAPEVSRIVTASLGGIGAARALVAAAEALSPGDVLIVELHGPGPNARGRGQQGYVPMEWWQPEFDAIQWATAKGIVVVEAAGNGGEDLDAPVYRGRFDKRVRDSGAILVGAGAPDGRSARSRLAFSNFGARVDVQGWGGGVATLDYGDLQGCADARRMYTARFAGTSSASPIVAGAALDVQGAWRATHAAPLGPRQMRTLLESTGTPQTGTVREHIGPLPDVEAALTALGFARALAR